jgi:sugar phosphate isomerase/epimerase
MLNKTIAVQMYTLRDAMDADYVGTLRAVAELGYRAVELTTLGSLGAAGLRKELDLLGLKATGMHIMLDRLDKDADAVISELQTLGIQYAICPWVAPELRDSAENYRALGQTLNRVGKAYASQGLKLCYHNHDFEFQRFGEQTGLEILMQETDPALVGFELDVFWAAYAGFEPIATIKQMAGRMPLVHLKDLSTDAQMPFAEVGHGTLDFPAILAACDEVGVEYGVVEQDRCARPPLESVGMSLAYLRSIGRA